MSRKTLLTIHLVFWALNLTITFVLFQFKFLRSGDVFSFWIVNLITWSISIAQFYFHYSVLIPRLVPNKRFILYAICLILLMLSGIMALGYNWNEHEWDSGFPVADHLVSPAFFSVFSHVFFSGALRMLEYYINSEKVKVYLKKEVKESELLYLKSQMSPHFLFNTLNNIYSLSLNSSENTPKALNELGDLMSYVEEFKNGKKVSLNEEIEHLKNFVALNNLRYACHVGFDCQISKNFDIEPLLLLPFIENAYKHGRTDHKGKIAIKLRSTDSLFTFEINNNLALDKRKDSVGGIGIKNIKRRLELIYGKRYKLYTSLENDGYKVSLTISRV